MYYSEMMNANRRNSYWVVSMLLFLIMFSSSVVTGCSGSSDHTTVGFLQEGRDLIMTGDGDYVIVGMTNLGPDYSSKYQGYLLKLDRHARFVWDLEFETYRICHGVVETDEGDYVIMSGYVPGAQLELQKRSVDGDIIWLRLFQSVRTANMSHNSIRQTTDGGYIITGGEKIGDKTSGLDNNALLLKTDADGNEIWRKTFGGDAGAYGMAVDVTDDGGYIISGYHNIIYPDYNIYLVKTDKDGQEEWSCTYEFDGYPRGIVVITSRSGGYLVVGDCNDWGYVLLRTDTEGNQLWHKNTCSSDDSVLKKTFTAIETDQGDIMVAGYSGPALYKVHVSIEKMDSLGNTLWERTYCLDGDNDHGADMAYSIKAVDNNCYILTGVMGRRFYDPDYKITGDIFLMKIDADGNMLGL